ncbi:MAG: cobalamin-dependent protein [Dehalococcoidia bacterium]|nr:cobalamin-dependent protein [Dehalococcoidia bacterium]MDP7469814.1 cobalamin-dependent protein [Dehalococcoidia bacterium]
MNRPIKVLMAKTSLDGHWRGVAVVTTALRDAGMEVTYGGMLTAKQIAEAAMQEDVDVIGLNIGGRLGAVEEVTKLLKEKGMGDRLVVAGGTIPQEDFEYLHSIGVAGIFPPGSPLGSIVDFVQQHVNQ